MCFYLFQLLWDLQRRLDPAVQRPELSCVCVNATIAAAVRSLCFGQEHRRKEKDIAVKLGFEFHRGYTQAIMASAS
jgi:hypothetical protein